MGFDAALCLNGLNDLNGQDSPNFHTLQSKWLVLMTQVRVCVHVLGRTVYFSSFPSFLFWSRCHSLIFFVTEMLPSLFVYRSLVVPSPAVSFPSSIASTMTLDGPCHFGLRDSENTHGGNSAPIQSRQHCLLLVRSWGEGQQIPGASQHIMSTSHPTLNSHFFSLLYLFSHHFLARFRKCNLFSASSGV